MRYVFILFIFCSLLFSSSFRQGMKSYKEGDVKKAVRLFKVAVKKDNSNSARYMLGKIHFFGEEVDKDIEKAQELLEVAAKYGNIKAKCILAGVKYEKGDIKSGDELLESGLKFKAKECKKIKKLYKK